MRGANKMNFNQATMMEAVQYWLDNVVFKEGCNQKVMSIDKVGSGYDQGFEVKLEEVVENSTVLNIQTQETIMVGE